MCRFTKVLACGLFLCSLIAFDRSSAEAEASNQANRSVATAPRTEGVKFSGLDASLKLSGTLLLPKPGPAKRSPAILLVAGSNLGDSNGRIAITPDAAWRELAAKLADRGLVVMHYQGRCLVGSGCGKDVSPHDMAEDAGAALAFLRRRSEVDPGRVILLGHDEGGLFAATIAGLQKEEKEKILGLIMVGTPGRTYVKLLREQAQKRLAANKASAEKANEYLAIFDKAVANATSGINDQVAIDTKDPILSKIGKYSIYFFHLSVNDPLQLVRTVEVPTLIVQGKKDAQVGERDAQYLNESMSRQYHGELRLEILPEMDHWMRTQKGEPDILAGDDPARPLDPAFTALLDSWIAKRLKEPKEAK
jgi:pimeloyl-ACP methyl ester carboxylesterase